MRVLEVGGEVFLLRFLPDSRRLVVGTYDEGQKVTLGVRSLPDGERVPLNVPRANLVSWWHYSNYGTVVAVPPSGEVCYVAWGGHLYAFRTADGKSLPVPRGVEAHQVVLSPNGDRLLAAYLTHSKKRCFAVTTGPKGGSVVWRKTLPQEFATLAGFLPDGERYVTVDGAVRVRSFATGEQLAASRTRPVGVEQPQISRDGRRLGLVGYGNMYFWDLTTLDKPRKIGGGSNFGDFRSFAFHPDGKMVAIIHGGPTLVKVYDLATLERVHTWKWKLGPLRSVAYSPSGDLGAAGSVDGRIVVWDVDD
jgi:WD40 repeat protein